MKRNVRELTKVDVNLIIDYFLNSTPENLSLLGVDENKLPGKNQWNKIIIDDLELLPEKRKFYYVIWEVNDIPVGHSNINDIVFGREAFMHLHIWYPGERQKGNGTYFVKESLKCYFEKFKLERIYCQPNASNDAPNKTLEKAGFTFIKKYETIPGWLNFNQHVNLWVMEKNIF
ncbi:MAG TPA: GNAT family N-acetyltransferase [Chitinophagaceae bacterium]|nr:GNAT family N-acetyltransferase [Chitinophagaceae bacterium]